MSTAELDPVELDFEDKLAKFEDNFSRCEVVRFLYNRRCTESNTGDVPEHTQKSFSELQPELEFLWKELVNTIPALKDTMRTSDYDDIEIDGQRLKTDITREILRAEIRTTLAHVRSLYTESLDDREELSGSQRATMKSLKRVLRERTQDLDALKRKHRQVDKQRYHLQEKVEKLSASVKTCEAKHLPMETELESLREQNASLQKRLTEREEAAKRFGAERLRFQSTIARYREELQLANYHTESAELELTQAKQKTEELEKRAMEAKSSSSAVSARVKELQEIQDAMLKLMHTSKENADPSSLRQNLQDLGEKRSRLVGRIANLLTRNRHNGTENVDAGMRRDAGESGRMPATELATKTGKGGVGSSTQVTEPSTPNFINSSSSSDTNASPREPEAGNRNPFLDGIRKLGNDLTRAKTNRARNEATRVSSPLTQRKSILDNVEKSRAAIENDVALREVIEMKEKELERMEDELYTAKEKAAALERSLQKERQKRRLENRTISAGTGEKLSLEASSVVLTRRRSLFDWQSGDAKKAASSDPSSADEVVPDKRTTARMHN